MVANLTRILMTGPESSWIQERGAFGPTYLPDAKSDATGHNQPAVSSASLQCTVLRSLSLDDNYLSRRDDGRGGYTPRGIQTISDAVAARIDVYDVAKEPPRASPSLKSTHEGKIETMQRLVGVNGDVCSGTRRKRC